MASDVQLDLWSGSEEEVDRPGRMSLVIERTGGEVIVSMSGELDAATASGVRRAIEAHAADQGCDVVIDLREIDFIDSAGLVAVAQMAERVQGEGRRLVLANPSDFVIRQLGMTAVCDVVDVEVRDP